MKCCANLTTSISVFSLILSITGKIFKPVKQSFYTLNFKNSKQFHTVIRGTTGGKYYRLLPEKENTAISVISFFILQNCRLNDILTL